MIKFGVRIIVEPDETGFHAYCPALKGLHTCGETKEEAIQNAKDAALA
jgi:predicted RNase H-like HicB family nuclease